MAMFFFLSPPAVRGGAVGEPRRASSIPVYQGRARTGLDFAPIRRKGPRPYLPSGYVLGPVYLSNPGLLGPENIMTLRVRWRKKNIRQTVQYHHVEQKFWIG